MKWSERDLQEYRGLVCIENICSDCGDCLKTKDEIGKCYWEMVGDLEEE